MTDKEMVRSCLDELPENDTFDRILEEIGILRAIERGRADVEAGRTKTHEEVKQLVKSWGHKWQAKRKPKRAK
jgi:predicted transcriptional regulator